MSQTTPPTVDALPTAPNTSAPSVFATLMDAFLAALITFRTQLVALGTNVYNNAVDCFNNASAAAASASSAATSVTSASASATSAAASAGAPVWVSGTTYAQFARVMSPANFKIYARTTASGSGTTDPSADATNYALILTGAFPYMQVREQQASGTGGGNTTNGFQIRTLNTTVGTNGITGATLASNLVSLPAGTYDFVARAPAYNGIMNHKLSLYNSSDSVDIQVGESTSVGASTNDTIFAEVAGRFTLSATKSVSLRHYINGAITSGLGTSVSSGQVEVFSSLQLWKVA